MNELCGKLIKYKVYNPTIRKIYDKYLLNELSALYPEINSNEAAALHLLNLKTKPTCISCSGEVVFTTIGNLSKSTSDRITIYGGWKLFCSTKCSRSSSYVVNKRKATTLERYGKESWSQTDEAKLTTTQPWSEEKKKTYKEKMTLTSLENCGYTHHSKSENSKHKKKETNLELYGVENTFQRVDLVQQGHISNYGMHYNKTDEGRKRLSDNNAMRNSDVAYTSFLKRRQNMYSDNLEFMNVLDTHDKTVFKDYINSLGLENRYEIANALKISNSFLNNLFRRNDMRDCYLYKSNRNSIGQAEVLDYIKSIYQAEVIISDRTILKPKEIDIYIPEFNLAIEYNGIYYHSEIDGGKDSSYHVGKTNGCESKGIQLLHIFESEWQDSVKQTIWKSIISNKLKCNSEKYYARKCTIEQISSGVSREFLDNNHLSGFCGAEVHLGMYYNEKLISVLSYGKSRFKEDEYEIIRFASLMNSNVVGALGKFMKLLPDDIITYADRRISSILNSGYSNFFEKVEILHPNWYGYSKKDYELKHRLSYQKHILKTLFDYDETLNAFDNMVNNGYDRIWDSGNIKFSKKK